MVKLIQNIKDCYRHIPYTLRHYMVVIALQQQFFGKVKYHFHDVDKLLMYIFLPFLGTKMIKKIHRRISSHHIWEDKPFHKCNYEEAIIDWESAHYSKPDKPLTAKEIVESKWCNSKHYHLLEQQLNNFNLLR